MSVSRHAAAALLIYLAAGAAMLHPALVGDQVLSAAADVVRKGPFPAALGERAVGGINCLTDSAQCFVPWLRFAADAFAADGHIPLWKDTAGAGAPLIGNGQSAVYFPTNLLAILLGAPPAVVALQALLKLAAGSFCAWLLARHLGLSFLASLLCGFVFGFGGFQVVWYLHPQTNVSLLLPLLVLAADRLVLAPSPARAGGLALVAGLQHLGGHPETAFHCQVAVLVLGGARSLSLRGTIGSRQALGRLGRLGWLVAGLCLGAAVGAVQMLPLLEYLLQSAALAGREEVAPQVQPVHALAAVGFGLLLCVALLALRRMLKSERGLAGSALLLFVATTAGLLFGLPAGLRPTFVLPLASDWFGTTRSFLGTVAYHEENGAFAGAALPLAVLGLLAGRPRGTVKAAGVALGVGWLAGYHAPLLSQVLEALPVFRVAMNSRLQLLALLATAVLAGCGLDALGAAARTAADRWRLLLAMLVPSLASVVALAIGVHLGLVSNDDAPARPEGAAIVEARALTAALADPLFGDEPVADTAEPCRVFRGYVQLAAPPTSIRLLYGSLGAAVEADFRAAPAVDKTAAPAAAAATEASGAQIYVLRAAVPERELLPGPWGVRVWAWLPGQGSVVSGLLAAPAAETPLPFPSQPAPGGATIRVLLLSLLVLGLAAAAPSGGPALAVLRLALPALVAASLLPLLSGMIPLLPRELVYPPSPALDALRLARPDGRVVSMKAWTLLPEVATYYGVADLRSYDGLDPERVGRVVDAALGRPGRTEPDQRREAPEPDFALLGLLSVRLLANLDQPPADFRPVAYTDGAGVPDRSMLAGAFPIVENPWYLPRARLVGGALVEPDDERALALLREPGFARERAVVLTAGAAREAPAQEAGSARITESRPDRVRVEIAPAAAGWLVLSDTFFPGWTARVDGQPREIVRANVAFRAVPVAPGERVVEFCYEPLSHRAGAALSLLAGLAAVCALLFRPRGRALTS